MLTILIASDNQALQSLLTSLVGRAIPGAVCVPAESCGSALELNLQMRPRIILFDASVMSRSGQALVEQLRADNVSASILLLSDQPYREWIQVMLDKGADGYLEITSESLVKDLYGALMAETDDARSVHA